MKLKVGAIKNIVILLFIIVIAILFLKIANSTNSEIVVLNKQEYPKLYSNWTVKFTTIGKEDLIIEGVKGAEYAKLTDNSYGDLELMELKCGEKILFNKVLFNKNMNIYNIKVKFLHNKVIFYNYSCPEISTWTVRLLQCKNHRQRFIFGDSKDYADNACSGTDLYTMYIKDPGGNQIQTCTQQTIDPVDGTYCDNTDTDSCSDYVICQKAGTYTANITCDSCSDAEHSDTAETTILTCYAPETNKFVIRNSTGGNISAFDEKGYLYLKGQNYTNVATLNPPPGSFVIKNSAGTNVAYINATGDLHLKGTFDENQTSLSPPTGSFILRNLSNVDIAYIDGNGNLNLTGWIYEEWLDPI